MVKCGVRDCTAKVVGGFEEYVYATASDHPPQIIDRFRHYWCAFDEDSQIKHLAGIDGRFLTDEELLQPLQP